MVKKVVISAIDKKLLMTLSENPKSSHKSIAQKMNLADTTVSRKLKKLRELGIYYGILPILNYQTLDLKRLTVWFETENSIKLKKMLNNVIGPHPYTNFQTLYLSGAFNESGIFVQFSIPIGTELLFKELFSQLLQKGKISNFQYIEHTEYWISKKIDVSCWNIEDNLWYDPINFNSETPWSFESWKEKVTSYNEVPIKRSYKSILNKLDLFDIILLREQSFDYSSKQSELIKSIHHKSDPNLQLRKEDENDGKIYSGEWEYLQNYCRKDEKTGNPILSKQEVSRRLNFLFNKSKIIEELAVSIDNSKFQLFNRLAVTGKCDKEVASLLYGSIQHKTLPFPMTISFSKNLEKFFLYCNLPPRELTKFNYWLYNDLGVTELRTMILDNYHSFRYPLWHGNFDNDKKSWISNKEWIINQSLKNIE